MAGHAHDLLAVAEEAGSVHGCALATLILGEAALFSGQLVRAEELLSGAERLFTEVGATAGRALAIQHLAEVAIARGRRWQAARLVNRGARLAERNWLAPHLLVRFLGAEVEAAPDAAHASVVIRRGEKLLAEQTTCQPCSMGFRVASSIAHARAGEVDRAWQKLDETERLAGMWQGGPWLAAVWEARGVLRQAQGEGEQAAALFREAAERFTALGRPLDQERCLAQVAI